MDAFFSSEAVLQKGKVLSLNDRMSLNMLNLFFFFFLGHLWDDTADGFTSQC